MFLSLIEKRRSIRKFLDKPVDSSQIDLLLEAGLRAPSSRGFQPWEFVAVTNPGMLEKLSKAKASGSSFLKNASLGIVVCGDPTRSDVWVEDCSIAAAFIMLTAEDMGLGACWIQIRERPHDDNTSAETYIRDILDIPPSMNVECIIAVGHPFAKKEPHRKSELHFKKLHFELYGSR